MHSLNTNQPSTMLSANAHTRLLRNLHNMNNDFINSIITKTGQQYWSRHYYNLGRFPISLVEMGPAAYENGLVFMAHFVVLEYFYTN